MQQQNQLLQQQQAVQQASVQNNAMALEANRKKAAEDAWSARQSMTQQVYAGLQPNDGLQTVATSLQGDTTKPFTARRKILGG